MILIRVSIYSSALNELFSISFLLFKKSFKQFSYVYVFPGFFDIKLEYVLEALFFKIPFIPTVMMQPCMTKTFGPEWNDNADGGLCFSAIRTSIWIRRERI